MPQKRDNKGGRKDRPLTVRSDNAVEEPESWAELSKSKSVIDFGIEKPNETPDYFRTWHSPQVTGPAFLLS